MTPTKKPQQHLHLVQDAEQTSPPSPAASAPASYTNRFGDTYHLHQGTTKTGKPRYFVARAVGAGALATMPEGCEFTESLNGVVSVRRTCGPPSLVPQADVDTVRRELARHPRLQHYAVDVRRDEIIVYERRLGVPGQARRPANALGQRPEDYTSRLRVRPQYAPAKFGRDPRHAGRLPAYCRYYWGEGGWLMLTV